MVERAATTELRVKFIRKILGLTNNNTDARFTALLANGFPLNGTRLFIPLWNYPKPFTGGHLPDGPLARTLRAMGLSEAELVAGLPRFNPILDEESNSEDTSTDVEVSPKRGLKRRNDQMEAMPAKKHRIDSDDE